jgi:hypothetical protein
MGEGKKKHTKTLEGEKSGHTYQKVASRDFQVFPKSIPKTKQNFYTQVTMAQSFWAPPMHQEILSPIKLLFCLPLIVRACHSSHDPAQGPNQLRIGRVNTTVIYCENFYKCHNVSPMQQ